MHTRAQAVSCYNSLSLESLQALLMLRGGEADFLGGPVIFKGGGGEDTSPVNTVGSYVKLVCVDATKATH